MMTSVLLRDSKARLLEAFRQILVERQQHQSKVATKEETAERERNQQAVEAAAQYTTDSIVRGLADLQLEFGSTIQELSIKLTTETKRLDELKRAIAVESHRLEELQQTRVVADALDILTQEHQENLRQLEQQAQRDREALEKEMTETRKAWQQEQTEYEAIAQEREALVQRERQWQEADYTYETERSRKIETDAYEEARRQLEREIQTTQQVKEKEWAARERTLAAQQKVLEEYQQKVEMFPAQLEDAIKQAREDGIREINQAAKVRADLFEKEWEATQQGYELQIQSLEAKIQKQAEQITELSAQLQAAVRQAQELAMRAFDSSNRLAPKGEKPE